MLKLCIHTAKADPADKWLLSRVYPDMSDHVRPEFANYYLLFRES